MIVSVIIPTRNRRHLLEGALASLERQEFSAGSFEIVVANDGSGDDTRGWLAAHSNRDRRVPLVVVDSPGRGAAAARNAAIGVAQGEWLAFFDDDCLAPADWLARAIDLLRRESVDVVGGPVRNVRPSLLSHVYQAMATHCYESRNQDRLRPHFLTSNNLVARAAAVRAVGGFSERFRCGGEDRDLLARLLEAGSTARYEPTLVVDHRHEFTTASYVSHHLHLGHGSRELHRAARRRGKPLPQVTPADLARLVRAVTVRTGEGDPPRRLLLALLGQAAVAVGALAAGPPPGGSR